MLSIKSGYWQEFNPGFDCGLQRKLDQVDLGKGDLNALDFTLSDQTAAVDVDVAKRVCPADIVQPIAADVAAVEQNQQAEFCEGRQQHHLIITHLAAVRQVQGLQIWHL